MKTGQTLAYAVLLFFFFQSLTALVESAYSFGLLSTSVPPESLAVLFVFSPVLLRLVRRPPAWTVPALESAAIGFRLVFPFVGPKLGVLFSGLAVSSSLLLFPLLLLHPGRRFPEVLSASLSVALAATVLFRVLGSGVDLSTSGAGRGFAWVIGVASIVVLLRAASSELRREDPGPGKSSLFAATGLMGCFGLLVSVFSSPNVVSRWGDFSYELLVLALFSGLVLYVVLQHLIPLDRRSLVWANAAVAACLLITVLPNQVDFPAEAGAYPLRVDPPAAWLTASALILMLLAPITIHTSLFFARELAELRLARRGALGFAFGSGLLAALLFAQIGTVAYDYVPVVGPVLRDRFWLVALVMAVIPIVALLGCRSRTSAVNRISISVPATILVMAAVSLAGLWTTRASPAKVQPSDGPLSVVTFNIQQGFARDGGRGLHSQLEFLRELDPDILGLQESDTNRISSGNSDAVRFFADNLDMYSYYGPSPVVGTFGVALLSKYPIESARTSYLWSEGEQTAVISARVRVNSRILNVFVTHLGNGGPIVQQEGVLREVRGHENVILLGDFNFRPGDEQYVATLGSLEDSWLLQSSGRVDDSDVMRDRAIDLIFVTPGMDVIDARYADTDTSDHPAYLVEIAR